MNPDPSRSFPIWPQPTDDQLPFHFPTRLIGAGPPAGGYNPPRLGELQYQNRVKSRRFYPKNNRKFAGARFAPYAPRNTTSFIIRAKKSGGIASLVSPCPVTPAILPTPKFSPLPDEGPVDMAKEEWGVDGYGSMKGLIRLRSGPGPDNEEEDLSSESDVEEHVEVERRLDHDLSRFEMVYPGENLVENRVDDQDSRIAHLEEENMTMKERLFLVEREIGDLRRRLLLLEAKNGNFNNNNNNNEEENDFSNNNMNGNEDEVCSGKNESNGTP